MNIITAAKTFLRSFTTTGSHAVRKNLDAAPADYTGNAHAYDGEMRVRLRPEAGAPLFRSRRPSPTDMPARMRMWDATGCPEIHQDITKTQVIPRIVPDGPEAAMIELAWNDVDAFTTAAHELRTTRSVDTVMAGLIAYVRRHPTEVLAPAYA